LGRNGARGLGWGEKGTKRLEGVLRKGYGCLKKKGWGKKRVEGKNVLRGIIWDGGKHPHWNGLK